MLTKGLRILWVKVNINGSKHFYLNLPMSLYAFEELLDGVMDLLHVACFITPKQQLITSSSISVHTVRSLVKLLIDLMNSLVGSESYELVDVELENIQVTIKIR